MKVLVYYEPKRDYDNFEGARLRKTIKGALEMSDVQHTSIKMDSYNIVHLISPNDLKLIDDYKKEKIPVVVSALYAEDDPNASYITEVQKENKKVTLIKPEVIKQLNKADVITVPCEDNISFLRDNGVDTKIKVLKPGVNLSRFDFSREDEKELFFRYFNEYHKRKLILAFGEYDPHMKGVNVFIDAAKKAPDALFYFVGRMTKLEKANLRIRKFINSAPSNVHFVTSMPDDIYRSALMNASVVVLPGYKTAGVVSLGEAMAAKCQILARKCTIYNGYLENGKNAQLVEYNETLTNLIRDFVDGKISSTVDSAYEYISTYTLTNMGNELKTIYESLINNIGGKNND